MISHQDKHWKPSTGSTLEDFVWSYLTTWMIFLTTYETFVKFLRTRGFATVLYIVEFSPLGPKNRSDSIRNGKNTFKMYFQAVYIYGNFGKF